MTLMDLCNGCYGLDKRILRARQRLRLIPSL